MIVIPPGQENIRLDDIPTVRSWPMPGLMRVVVGSLVAGMLVVGIQMSNVLTVFVGKKLQAGVIGNWNTPVQLIFLGWVAILVVAAVILTIVDLWNAAPRDRAEQDRGGWELSMRARERLATGLKGETLLAYTEADSPEHTAPLFFERLFFLLVVFAQVAGLVTLQRIAPIDGYQAFLLWLTFGLASTMVACAAMLYCRPSRSLVVALMVWTPIVQRVHFVIDPASTGPALGLPAGSLSVFLAALTVGTGLAVIRGRSSRRLFLVTTAGIRTVDVDGEEVSIHGRADLPLRVVGTPAPTGISLQVAGRNGEDKIPALRIAGSAALQELKGVLGAAFGDKAKVEGRDDTSGIAGRLGEVPLLGWLVAALLILVSQQSLLPPIIGWLQVNTLLEVYADDLAQGETRMMENALEGVLAMNPALGPAITMKASILLRKGKKAEAAKLLDGFLKAREPWADAPLVKQARKLREEAGG